MENLNNVKRSELWSEIYNIIKQIPRKDVDEDAMDAPSATTAIELLFQKYKVKADKWDALESKIDAFYEDEDGEGDLFDIGEVAAMEFGYL
jgi:hypothetical protein